MNQRNNNRITESGVSELIGAIILIAMIVLLVAVVAAFLTNRPASNEIPEVRFSVVNVSTYGQCYNGGVCSINITHMGGDNLNPGDYSFFINDNSAPVFPGYINPDPLSNSWSVGKTVMVTSSIIPDYVRVYYYNTTKVNNPALLGQRTIGTIPPTSTTSPTSSPTTTTTTTTTVTTIITTTPTPCPPPIVGFTYIQANTPAFTIAFTSTSTGTGTLSYQWNFGDGSSNATGSMVTHTFPGAGTYNVILTVTDSCNSNSVVRPVTVSLPSCAYIDGTKWNDLNNNGKRDAGEPGLANWEIKLYSRSGNQLTLVKTTYTNIDGYYIFTDLTYTDQYEVWETVQPAWVAKNPTSGIYTQIVLNSASKCKSVGNDFGNHFEPPFANQLYLNAPSKLGTLVGGRYMQFRYTGPSTPSYTNGWIQFPGERIEFQNGDIIKLEINGDQSSGSLDMNNNRITTLTFNIKVYKNANPTPIKSGIPTGIYIEQFDSWDSSLAFMLPAQAGQTYLHINGVTIIDYYPPNPSAINLYNIGQYQGSNTYIRLPSSEVRASGYYQIIP
jgi:flagellin-like protein